MDDRVGLPVVVQSIDGKTLEQLTLSLENRLKRGDRQRLSEPSGTGEEVQLVHPHDHRGQIGCLVHVQGPFLPELLERTDGGREMLLRCGHASSIPQPLACGKERPFHGTDIDILRQIRMAPFRLPACGNLEKFVASDVNDVPRALTKPAIPQNSDVNPKVLWARMSTVIHAPVLPLPLAACPIYAATSPTKATASFQPAPGTFCPTECPASRISRSGTERRSLPGQEPFGRLLSW